MSLTRRQTLQLGAGVALASLPGLRGALAQNAPLNLKAIPSSGVRLPMVGIGARNYRLGPNWSPDTGNFIETLRTFHSLGGTLVDTSPNYGDSENIVGGIIADLGIRNGLFMATKVDRRDRAAGEQRMHESLQRLRTDHVELMQVHNLIGWREQLPLLREWKQAGRIGHYGITTSDDDQYTEMAAIMQQEEMDFIQVDYALDHRTAAEILLPLAADRGMAVLVNMPFGRGRLFERVRGVALPDWASGIGCTSWAQVFLKYVISHPAVTAAIPGTTKPHHAVDNLNAARGVLPDPALRRTMEEFIDALPG